MIIFHTLSCSFIPMPRDTAAVIVGAFNDQGTASITIDGVEVDTSVPVSVRQHCASAPDDKDGIVVTTTVILVHELLDTIGALVEVAKCGEMVVRWAYTSDPPVVDAFGGGAALVVSRNERYIVDTDAEITVRWQD